MSAMRSSVFAMLSGEGGGKALDIALTAPDDMADKVLLLRGEAEVEVRFDSMERLRSMEGKEIIVRSDVRFRGMA